MPASTTGSSNSLPPPHPPTSSHTATSGTHQSHTSSHTTTSSNPPSYRAHQAAYAILLTYIPTGIHVRATPASRLTKIPEKQKAQAGLLTQLTVHQPSKSASATTLSSSSSRGAEKILELDIEHNELTMLGLPWIEKLSQQQGASSAEKSTFLEWLIAQLCVYINSNDEYKLVFTPSATKKATSSLKTSSEQPAAAQANPPQQQHHVHFQRITHHVVKTTTSQTSSAQNSDNEYESDYNDANFVDEMIPPAVVAAAASETPAIRSPLRRGSSGASSPTSQQQQQQPPSSHHGIASMSRRELSAANMAAAGHQHQRPSNLPTQPRPQSTPTLPHMTTAQQQAYLSSNSINFDYPQQQQQTSSKSPQMTAVLDDLAALRKENSELRHKNSQLQSQLDLKANTELAHLHEIAALKKKLDEAKDTLYEYEEQLFLLQPNIKSLTEHGISPGGQNRPRSGSQPSSPIRAPPRSPLTGFMKSEIEEQQLQLHQQQQSIHHLQQQLSQSQATNQSLTHALTALQTSYKQFMTQLQHEFHSTGETLRLSNNVAKDENAFVQELLGDHHTTDGTNNSWQSTFSPRKQEDAMRQSFHFEDELRQASSGDDSEDEIAAWNSSLRSQTVDLAKIQSMTHDLTQRSLKLLAGVHERNRLLHGNVTAIQMTGKKVKAEVSGIFEDISKGHPPPSRLEAFRPQAFQSSSRQEATTSPSATADLKQALDDRTTALEIKNQQLNYLKQTLQDKDSEVDDLQRQLASLQTKVTRMEMKNSAAILLNDQTSSTQQDSVNSTMASLQAHIESLQNQLEFTQKDLCLRDEKMHGLELAFQEAQKGFAEEYRRKDQELGSLERQIDAMTASIKNPQSSIVSSSAANTRRDPLASSSTLVTARSTSERTEIVLSGDEQSELVLLRSELSNLRKLHTTNSTNILQIHNDLNQKNMKLIELQTENLNLARMNQRMDEIIQQAKHQTKILSKKLQTLEHETLPKLVQENETLKATVEEGELKQKEFQIEIKNLQRELFTLRSDYNLLSSEQENGLKPERDDLSVKLSTLRQDHTALQTKIVELEVENSTLTDRLSRVTREDQVLNDNNQNLSQQLARAQNDVNELSATREMLESKVRDLNERNHDLEAQVDAASRAQVTFSYESENWTREKTTYEHEARMAKQDHASLEQQLTATRAQLTTLQTQLNTVTGQYEEMKRLYRDAIEDVRPPALVDDNQRLNQQILGLKQSVQVLQGQYDELSRAKAKPAPVFEQPTERSTIAQNDDHHQFLLSQQQLQTFKLNHSILQSQNEELQQLYQQALNERALQQQQLEELQTAYKQFMSFFNQILDSKNATSTASSLTPSQVDELSRLQKNLPASLASYQTSQFNQPPLRSPVVPLPTSHDADLAELIKQNFALKLELYKHEIRSSAANQPEQRERGSSKRSSPLASDEPLTTSHLSSFYNALSSSQQSQSSQTPSAAASDLAKDDQYIRQLETEQDIALQSYEILKNQAAVNLLTLQKKDDELTAATRQLNSLQRQCQELNEQVRSISNASASQSAATAELQEAQLRHAKKDSELLQAQHHIMALENSLDLLKNQTGLHSTVINKKDTDLSEVQNRCVALEHSLEVAEQTIQTLQGQVRKSSAQNDESIQAITSLNQQLKGLQQNLQQKTSAQGDYHTEISQLMTEKNELQAEILKLKQEVHSKTLQLTDSTALVSHLEHEIESFKLNVLLPYQKNHLDIGCESLRMQLELEVSKSEETIKVLNKNLKAKDSQIVDLLTEISHTKSSLEQGNNQWVTQVPALKRDLKLQDQVLDSLREDLKSFAAMLDKAKKEKKLVGRKNAASASDSHGRDSPFRTSDLNEEHHHQADFGASGGEFDFEQHLSALSASASSASNNSSNNNSHKYHSIFTMLLHDLSPILHHYIDLMKYHQETSLTITTTQRKLEVLEHERDASHADWLRRLKTQEADLVREFDQERAELQKKVNRLEAELHHTSQDSSKHAQRYQSASSEVNDTKRQLDHTQERLAELTQEHEQVLQDKKELQQDVDALLACQKAWEKERDMMIESTDKLTRQKDKFAKTAEQLQKDLDHQQREYDSLTQKTDLMKKDLQRSQGREKDYTDTIATLRRLEDQTAVLQDSFTQREKELLQANQEVQERQQECRLLQEELAETKQQRDLTARSLEKMKLVEVEYQRRVVTLESQVTDLQTNAREPLVKLREVHGKTQIELVSWQEKYADLHRQHEETEREYARQMEHHREYITKMKEEMEHERVEWQREADDAAAKSKVTVKQAQEAAKAAEEKRVEQERQQGTVINGLNKTVTTLRNELKNTTEKLTAIEADHTELQQSNSTLTSEHTALEKAHSKLETEHQQAQSSLDAVSERARKVQKELEKLQRESSLSLRESTRDAEVQRLNLEKELEKKSTLVEQHEREITRLERALELTQLERKEFEMKAAASQKALTSVERELAAKADSLERLERQRAEELKTWQEKLYVYDTAQRKAQDQLFTVEQRLKDMEVERSHVQRTNSDLERKIHELEYEQTAMNKAASELSRKNSELDLNLSSVQREFKECERRLHDSQAQNDLFIKEKVPRLETAVASLTQTLYERQTEKDAAVKRCHEVEYSMNESRAKLEYDLTTARKEASQANMKVASLEDVQSQLRATISQLERENSYKSAQYQQETQGRDSQIQSLQQSLSKLQTEKELLDDRSMKVEKKLKELSQEYDLLQKAHSKSLATLQSTENALTKLQDKDNVCQTVHFAQWEPLLERTKKDLKEQMDLVSELRDSLQQEKLNAKKIQDEMKFFSEDTLMKKDRACAEDMTALKRLHQKELDSLNQSFERLHQEYDAANQEHQTALTQHLDRIHSLQSTIEQKQHDLERIRVMLGLSWEELLSMTENSTIRERARSLFNVESQLSITQLQDLVKQQNLHLTDSKLENVELNKLIDNLKAELQMYKQQKSTEHSTMDKLLTANKRLQQFIDQLPQHVRVSGAPGSANTNSSYAIIPTPSSIYASRAVSPYISPVKESQQQQQSFIPSSASSFLLPPPSMNDRFNEAKESMSGPSPINLSSQSTPIIQYPSSQTPVVRSTSANSNNQRDGLDALRQFIQAQQVPTASPSTAARPPPPSTEPSTINPNAPAAITVGSS